jgi:hypothetical protein
MGITFFTLLLAQINIDEATPGLQKSRGGCMPSLLSDRKKKVQKNQLETLSVFDCSYESIPSSFAL